MKINFLLKETPEVYYKSTTPLTHHSPIISCINISCIIFIITIIKVFSKIKIRRLSFNCVATTESEKCEQNILVRSKIFFQFE